MIKNEKHISLAAIIFSLYIVLFPIDSALGSIIGNISLNNYIAILCTLVTIILCIRRIEIFPSYVLAIYWFYFLYQTFGIVLHNGDLFSNRNIIFIFYGIMTIILSQVKWTKRELNIFIKAIIGGLVLAIAIIMMNINFDSSGRLYLSVGRNIDQNYLCANFIFGTAVIVNSLFFVKKKIYRCFLFTSLFLEFVCILFLGARGGLIGNTLVSLSVVFTNISKSNRKKLFVFFILLVPIVFIAAKLLLPQWIFERFNIVNLLNDSENSRISIWRDYFEFYKTGNLLEWLFGFGRGIIYSHDITEIYKCTHSIYVKALVESGIIGILFIASLFISIIVQIKKAKNSVLLSILIGYCTCGLFLDLDDFRIFPLMILMLLIYTNNKFYVQEEK